MPHSWHLAGQSAIGLERTRVNPSRVAVTRGHHLMLNHWPFKRYSNYNRNNYQDNELPISWDFFRFGLFFHSCSQFLIMSKHHHLYPKVTSDSVIGLVVTDCSSKRRKTRPLLREVLRLNLKVNSSKYDCRCSGSTAPW